MAREATFNFIPAHQVESHFEGGEFTVTILTHPAKRLSFPTKHPETQALIGKYVIFYVDQVKNTLAWKVFKEGDMGDLTNAVPVKTYEFDAGGKNTSKTVNVSIAKPLSTLKFTPGKSYKKLKVKKYRPQGYINDGRDYYYVRIPTGSVEDDEE